MFILRKSSFISILELMNVTTSASILKLLFNAQYPAPRLGLQAYKLP